MSLHVFANFVTAYGAAANNRGETDGNLATLQKLVWRGEVHTTVSAEAIRFALRRQLEQMEPAGANRRWDEERRVNTWRDDQFRGWTQSDGPTFIDDDLLGFMAVEAAKEEGSAGSARTRRGALEVTRAVSLTPWPGDVTFYAASPGAAPSAQRKGTFPVPFAAEVHATRYQFGVALTPERLRQPARTAHAVRALGELGPVAGNHARHLFDFSPEAVVLRLTDDPAPRLLYCFGSDDEGETLHARSLVQRIERGDVAPEELLVGLADGGWEATRTLEAAGVAVSGVRAAVGEACRRIERQLLARE